MNLQQAYSTFGLSPSASMDEVKAIYKKKAFELHPDRNKDPNAIEELKKINQAYSTIKNPPQPNSPFHRAGVEDVGFDIDLNEIFSNFGFGGQKKTPQRQILPIQLNLTLTFTQSITGAEQMLTFNRQIKCEACQGLGQKPIHNGCSSCNGTGQIQSQAGNMFFSQTCSKCRGKVSAETCIGCQGKSYLEKEVSVQIKIPAGVQDKTTLRLQGLGHFVCMHNLFGEQYGDVLLHLTVEKHPVLSLQIPDVICSLNLTLLEALEGCEKTVPTINGEKKITIPSNSRHKEEIKLAGLGVKEQGGSQRIIFEVNYPEDKKPQLLELLRN